MNFGSFASRVVATKVVATDGTGDFTDIQDAVDDLPAGGGVVYIKEGTYTITSAVVIANSNTAIIGAGHSTKIINNTSLSTIFSASAKTHLHFEKLYLYSSAKANNVIGILSTGCDYTRIVDCWFENLVSSIYDGSSTNVIIANNFFTGCSITISVAGDYITIISNQLGNCDYGISGGPGDYLIISNNIIHDMANEGIYLNGANQCVITNNIIRENVKHGIHLSNVDNSTIDNNICWWNDSNGTSSYDGIFVENGSDRNVFCANSCAGNDRYQINLSNANCDDNTIVSNLIGATGMVGGINDLGTRTELGHNKVV